MSASRFLLATLSGGAWRNIRGLLLIAFALVLIPTSVRAACFYTNGSGSANVTFNPPSTITVPFTASVGTVLYTSPYLGQSSAPLFRCTSTSSYGITPTYGGTPATSTAIFPTSISGIGFSLTYAGSSSNYLYPYPAYSLPAGYWILDTTYSVQLVKTGPIVSGSTLSAGSIAYFNMGNSLQLVNYFLGNSVTIVDPACSVNTTPINVTLPTVGTNTLPAVGATTGTTGFVIALTCASGATLAIQLDYAGTASGITGVLTPTSGSSAGVGIRVLDSSSNPVTFGTASVVGSTVSGQMNLQYYAQYYRTAAITSGPMGASATFTLSYQ